MTLDPERAAHERAMDEAAGLVVPLGELLDTTTEFLRRFVSMSEPQAATLALFVVHTHAIHAAQATPYISVSTLPSSISRGCAARHRRPDRRARAGRGE